MTELAVWLWLLAIVVAYIIIYFLVHITRG